MYFSIVVPVYNVKQYLVRCVESVLSQSFMDYEIILVDDGSTDGSSELCDEIKERDQRVKVVHQENGGLSAARNRGLELSLGTYIILLDGDDCLVEDSLQRIVERIGDYSCDVFVGYAFSVDERFEKREKGFLQGFPQQPLSGVDYVETLGLYRKEVAFCAPFMIYKSSYIRSKQLRFKCGLLHEDELWTPIVLINANEVLWINLPFYYHYVRSGSIMHSKNYEKKAQSILDICKILSKTYSEYRNRSMRYLKDRMAMIYLTIAPYVDNPRDYKKTMGPLFAIKNSRYADTRIKAIIFLFSANLYRKIYNTKKNLQERKLK